MSTLPDRDVNIRADVPEHSNASASGTPSSSDVPLVDAQEKNQDASPTLIVKLTTEQFREDLATSLETTPATQMQYTPVASTGDTSDLKNETFPASSISPSTVVALDNIPSMGEAHSFREPRHWDLTFKDIAEIPSDPLLRSSSCSSLLTDFETPGISQQDLVYTQDSRFAANRSDGVADSKEPGFSNPNEPSTFEAGSLVSDKLPPRGSRQNHTPAEKQALHLHQVRNKGKRVIGKRKSRSDLDLFGSEGDQGDSPSRLYKSERLKDDTANEVTNRTATQSTPLEQEESVLKDPADTATHRNDLSQKVSIPENFHTQAMELQTSSGPSVEAVLRQNEEKGRTLHSSSRNASLRKIDGNLLSSPPTELLSDFNAPTELVVTSDECIPDSTSALEGISHEDVRFSLPSSEMDTQLIDMPSEKASWEPSAQPFDGDSSIDSASNYSLSTYSKDDSSKGKGLKQIENRSIAGSRHSLRRASMQTDGNKVNLSGSVRRSDALVQSGKSAKTMTLPDGAGPVQENQVPVGRQPCGGSAIPSSNDPSTDMQKDFRNEVNAPDPTCSKIPTPEIYGPPDDIRVAQKGASVHTNGKSTLPARRGKRKTQSIDGSSGGATDTTQSKRSRSSTAGSATALHISAHADSAGQPSHKENTMAEPLFQETHQAELQDTTNVLLDQHSSKSKNNSTKTRGSEKVRESPAAVEKSTDQLAAEFTAARARQSRRSSSLSTSSVGSDSNVLQSSAIDKILFPFERVFILYNNFYYAGTLTSIEGGKFITTFDDTSFAEVSLSEMPKQLLKCQLHEGDIVVRAESVAGAKKGGQRFRVLRIEAERTRRQKAPEEYLCKEDIVIVQAEIPAARKKGRNTPWKKGNEERWLVEATTLMAGKNELGSRSISREEQEMFRGLLGGDAESDTEKTVCSKGVAPIIRARKAPGPNIDSKLFEKFGFIFTTSDGSAALAEEMKESAESGGGTVVEDVSLLLSTSNLHSDSQTDATLQFSTNQDYSKLETILLLSKAAVSTPKYLKALAVGIPCVSLMWMKDSIKEERVLDWQPYCLGAGYSPQLQSQALGLQAFILNCESYSLAAIAARQQRLRIFLNRKVVFCHSSTSKGVTRGAMARDLLTALGAVKVLVAPISSCPSNQELDKYDLFVSDSADEAKQQIQNRKIATWDWVKECIVAGRLLASPESRIAA